MEQLISVYKTHFLTWQLDNIIFLGLIWLGMSVTKFRSALFQKSLIFLAILKTLAPPILPNILPGHLTEMSSIFWFDPIVITMTGETSNQIAGNVWIIPVVGILILLLSQIILLVVLYRKKLVTVNHLEKSYISIITPFNHSPFLIGFFKYIIFLPKQFTQWPAEHQSLAIEHELAHAHFKDPFLQFIMLPGILVNVLNPFLWLLLKKYHALTEYLADSHTIKKLQWNPDQYADTLLDIYRYTSLNNRYLLFQSGLFSGFRAVRERIALIISPKEEFTMRKKLIFSIIFTIITSVFLLFACQRDSNPSATETIQPEKSTYDGVVSYKELSKKPDILNREILDQYPEIMKQYKVEGKIIVRLTIDEVGKVIGTEVLKNELSSPELDDATILQKSAEKLVQLCEKIEFTPAEQDGNPVKTQVVIPFVYRLK
ncbi:MAG: hypothetical protein Kow00108_20690 [Calditrichia bacterium]